MKRYVEVLIDGTTLTHFVSQDTGDFGSGWNTFFETDVLGAVSLAAGAHTLQIKVSGGDSFGVEIDVVTFERVP